MDINPPLYQRQIEANEVHDAVLSLVRFMNMLNSMKNGL
jgi:hypothetical protein